MVCGSLVSPGNPSRPRSWDMKLRQEMIRICRKWWLLKIRTFLANTFFRHPRNCAPFWLAYSGCFFRKSTFYGSSPKIQQFSPSILNTKIAIISNKLSKIIIIFKYRILDFCSFWTSEASRTTPKRSELPLPLLQKNRDGNQKISQKSFACWNTAIVSRSSSSVHWAPESSSSTVTDLGDQCSQNCFIRGKHKYNSTRKPHPTEKQKHANLANPSLLPPQTRKRLNNSIRSSTSSLQP